MEVNYLLGTEDVYNIPMAPYEEETIEFLNDIARALLKDSEAKQYPDIVSYAFWCRRTNLTALKEAANLEEGRIGKGLVFHITPSNIPVNFAFSYAFGMLSGNANIVRVPSRNFPQVDILTRIFQDTLREYPEIAKRSAWIRYPADMGITEYFSEMADARLLWGGDRTISQVRQGKCRAKSLDIVFADRYSIGIVDGKAVLETSEKELQRLAGNFYNDTWLIDQNACSSPQLIVWIRSDREAKKRFWDAVLREARRRYILHPASAMDKYVQLCNDAVNYSSIQEIHRDTNLLYHIQMEQLPKDTAILRGNCGYFYEYDIENLKQLKGAVTEKFQTVTYFGINPKKIQEWILEQKLRGIDRIVPFGKALDINVLWDGYDIIRMLSRLVIVE